MSEEIKETSAKFEALIPQIVSIFMTYGIKSVTMDDVARHLRLSKKTLYQYVTDKSNLVQKCISYDCGLNECGIRSVVNRNLNAIQENIEISKMVMAQLKSVHPSIFYDLEKYYPDAWKLLQETREELAFDVIRTNIQKGISEGLFRPDLHVEIITRLWVTRMNVIFDPKLFPMQEFSLTEVYEQLFTHQIRGIASIEGLVYFEKHQKDITNLPKS